MSQADLVRMLVNLSESMPAVIRLLLGFAYLTGIALIFGGILQLKGMGQRGGSGQRIGTTVAYFLGGAVLLFLPSAVTAISNSTFGTSNVLAYMPVNPFDIEKAMTLVVQTAGLVWFIRGISLLVGASHPGVQHGSKGFVFLFAGIFALNFQLTVETLNQLVSWLADLSIKVKDMFGY